MGTFFNTSTERQIWPRLLNALTGATLELDPGESAPVQHWVTPTDAEGKPTGAPACVDFDDASRTSFLGASPEAPTPPSLMKPTAPKPEVPPSQPSAPVASVDVAVETAE